MSLFGDEEDNTPWGVGTHNEPKWNNESIDTLLQDTSIPRTFNETFVKTNPIGGFTTITALKNTLTELNITENDKETILETLAVVGNSVNKDQWNVGMALAALSQRAEPLSIEAVKQKRGDLPELRLTTATPLQEDNAAIINGDDNNNETWTAPKTAEEYNPLSKDTINIQIMPEKEGMFMFRHVVYVIEGSMNEGGEQVRVVRRYSDFLWLLECLVKLYPFRLLPVLPPKRLAVDGRYLSNDSYFLERRRRGLTRFVNQLIKHPILKREKLVQMFLTVDTELSVWRKQAQLQIKEEFDNRIISPQFVKQWNNGGNDEQISKWRTIRQGTEDAIEILNQLVVLVDRLYKRQEAMANDFKKMSIAFNSLKNPLSAIYYEDTSDLESIKQGVLNVARYTSNSSELCKDESNSIDIGYLEDMKQLRELIAGIRELFYRHDKYGGNNIAQLQQRIELNEKKLQGLSQRHDSKPSEIDKLAQSITNDKQSIKDQTNRDWLIKECLVEELELCQKTQYQVSKVIKEWTGDAVKYSELHQNNYADLNTDVQNMPLI